MAVNENLEPGGCILDMIKSEAAMKNRRRRSGQATRNQLITSNTSLMKPSKTADITPVTTKSSLKKVVFSQHSANVSNGHSTHRVKFEKLQKLGRKTGSAGSLLIRHPLAPGNAPANLTVSGLCHGQESYQKAMKSSAPTKTGHATSDKEKYACKMKMHSVIREMKNRMIR